MNWSRRIAKKYINDMLSTDFIALKSKEVAKALVTMLEKYYEQLIGPLSMVALAIDRAVSKTDEKIDSLKK